MIRYIFHISDIHIMDSSYVNLENSFEILIATIVKHGIDNSLLVIAGDIFETKNSLSTDDIHQWKTICGNLEKEKIQTLIMCGNHDYNINSTLSRDNVSLLTGRYNNIHCVNKTGILSGECFGDARLKFHMFSPIDKLIPRIKNNNGENKYINIAVLHEPINCAKYDNGETITNSRFNANDLSDYDYVLLGDIHLTQFLTNRIAYCGSFVQKNKGEGINKGYILWDLNQQKGIFHAIPLKEIYLKIEANANKCNLPTILKGQIIRHITLIYKDCAEDYLEALKEEVGKLGYINRYIDVNSISISNTVIQNTNNRDGSLIFAEAQSLQAQKPIQMRDHTESIRDILTNAEKSEEEIQKILDYHKEKMLDRNGSNFTTYKLNYVYWSNIFCYGEDNYINFNEFKNNLVMLNGKNKQGKSSIIDIIIRGLFNECERGFKEDIVNKAKVKGHIKISFNIGVDEYIIEQIFHRTAKNQYHRLYKNGNNITQDTIIHTYDYLRNTIGLGDYKDFVNMTTALQNRKFLVDMTQKDFISLLTKITNIDVMKDIEEETKKKISSIKVLMRKNEKDVLNCEKISEDDLIIFKTKMEKTSDSHAVAWDELNAINSKLIELNLDYNSTPIPDNINETINELEKNLGRFDIARVNEITSVLDVDKITEELWVLTKKMESIQPQILKKVMKTDYSQVLTTLDRVVITQKIKDLEDVTYKPTQTEFREVSLLKEIIQSNIQRESQSESQSNTLEPLERCSITELKELVDIPDAADIIKRGLPDYDQLNVEATDLLKKIRSHNANFSKLKFEDSCSSCNHNKESITYIFDISSEKIRLKKLRSIINNEVVACQALDAAIAYTNGKLQNEIWHSNQRIIVSNNAITERLNAVAEAKAEMKEISNKRKWDTLQKLKHQLNLFRESEIQSHEIERRKLHYAKEYHELKTQYRDLLSLSEIRLVNNEKQKDIGILTISQDIKKKQYEVINDELKNVTEKYNMSSMYYTQQIKLNEEHLQYVRELEFLNLYYLVINCKTGIPSIVLQNTCKAVQDNCNRILQKIADFVIEIAYEKDIRIYTIENEKKIPASMGSGMQKFILDLIFRITLTEISSISSPKTLFIDEGLGCLDKENFIAVANILKKLKSNFDSLIIISHISELQAYCDISVNITRSGYHSHVQHGILTEEEKYIQLNDEIAQNNKHTIDFKNSVKSNKEIKLVEITGNHKEIIESYCNANGGINAVLFEIRGNKMFCKSCEKEFSSKSGNMERHVAAVTYKPKHNKFILTNAVRLEKK
jgi:exonuclease SbcC